MASLRLTFPEKDQPTVIALTGARLTIGRLPFNTIQIIDRTVSGFHAELIKEPGHYRLHDRGSSNGTYVNGQKVSDYHLSEACTISFGTVEVQFDPADVASEEEAETFPSRGEVNAVRQENAEMKATVAALREEIDALRQPATPAGEGAPSTVSREEFERVVVEREALKEAQLRQEEEINRLKTDLAILKRDRLNLQLAYDGAQRESEQMRRQANGGEEQALPPVQAAAIVAAQADEVRIEVPKTAANAPTVIATPVPSPAAAEAGESAIPTPEPGTADDATATTPIEPTTPAAPLAPAAALPKAPAAFGQMSKPGLPGNVPARPNPLPPSQAPTAAPSSGLRPVMRPIAPAGAGQNGGGAKPGNGPVTRVAHKPLPPPRKIPMPTVKLKPMPEGTSGPKGTQKLSE